MIRESLIDVVAVLSSCRDGWLPANGLRNLIGGEQVGPVEHREQLHDIDTGLINWNAMQRDNLVGDVVARSLAVTAFPDSAAGRVEDVRLAILGVVDDELVVKPVDGEIRARPRPATFDIMR